MLAQPLENEFLRIVGEHTGEPQAIDKVQNLSGGCINNAYKVTTGDQSWFIKWNYADSFPGMFETECQGLVLLKKAGEVFVPAIAGYGTADNYSLLVLEFVQQAQPAGNFWEDFGTSLAKLHQHSHTQFGLDHQNYIGSLPQYNDFQDHWVDFFITQRLEVQIKMARDKGLMDNSLVKKFDSLYRVLDDFFPQEKPALLHGDLWSGNYMCNSQGKACIIDPAVYYGHRLMDIGMSKLFGGFSEGFYQAYHAAFPMHDNWRQACDIANLYPLMVHVNLFGGGYLGSVRSTLGRF